MVCQYLTNDFGFTIAAVCRNQPFTMSALPPAYIRLQ